MPEVPSFPAVLGTAAVNGFLAAVVGAGANSQTDAVTRT